MTIQILHGESDQALDHLIGALGRYENEFPTSRIDIYRQGRFSIRIRVIDDGFADMSRVARNELVWKYLDQAPEEAIADVVSVLTLTSSEAEKSFASVDFDNPIASEF